MIETILFITTVIFITGITMMEAQHDFWIIKFLYPGSKGQWKIWGNLYEICWIIFISAIVAELLNKYSPLLWILILWFIRWAVHDCFLGKLLKNDWFYLSEKGFDGFMKRIFQNGFLYLIWKVVILIIATGSYFAIK